MNIQNINISYETDAMNTYMVIKANSDIDIENYEVEMLKRNQIDSFLDLNVQQNNLEKILFYNITSKQRLTEILQRKKLVYQEIIDFYTNLTLVIKNSKRYYLSSHKIILNPSLIYISPDKLTPYFVYTPFKTVDKDIVEELKELIEFLFDKVDTNDVKAVMLMHKIYTASKKQNFNLNIIKDIIDDNSIMKENETYIEDKVDIVNGEDKGHIEQEGKEVISMLMKQNEEINKPKIDTSVKSDSITKIKPKKKYNNSILEYIIIGSIQVAIILLSIASIESKVLYSDITGKLKIESVFALLALLLSIDIYISKKILEHISKQNNKDEDDNINMNKCKVYNEPEINTFNRTKKDSLLKSQHIENNKQQLNINMQHNSIGDISKKNDSEIDYICEDTQLLDSYNENLHIEIKPYLLSKDDDIINKITISSTPYIIGKLNGQVDFIIKNSSVSRIHCKIIKEEDIYYIIDLNSKNGTYLDEERLISNRKYQLYDGSRITISNCDYTFEMEGLYIEK
ncbi:MAG: FHA domain-containing protein [Vallitalea sp.]|jgi:hypothetical protein|nr:FHA domain-containing protein [Vallitalea sp.]